jgi:hypothetical protein
VSGGKRERRRRRIRKVCGGEKVKKVGKNAAGERVCGKGVKADQT